MDVWAITVAVFRRWYIFLPLLALTAVTAFWIGSRATEQYQAESTVVLVPGSTTSEIANPYGGMGETAQILEIVLGAAPARDQVGELGLSTDYVVDTRSQTRIVDLSAGAASEDAAVKTIEVVIGMMQEELAGQQDEAGIPEAAQIGVEVLQPPTVTGVTAEGKLRNMAVVGVAGAAFSLLVALLFDDIMGWLKRRRPGSTTEGEIE